MASEIFENSIRKLDQKFRVNGKKIVLTIDNCPAHLLIPNLTNSARFFCSLTQRLLQPMDQDVIRTLKAHYRGRVVAVQSFEELQPFGNEKGMKILANSWEILTIETIVNCFRKSGISFTVQQAVINGGFY